MKKECIAMLLAGGQGSRLYVLTGEMAKPAVPFGGKYRIIDFPLSNCSNSGIDTVGVLTQYRPLELNSYIGSGQPWDLDGSTGGVHILPPYMGSKGGTWYKGTANAIYQNIGFIDLYDPDYVVILSGDHIYKMDYSDMVARHKAAGAACTISVMEVPWEEASRFGIMSVNEEDMITEFAEKPKEPKSNLASMGIYVFSWKTLRRYLTEDGSYFEIDPEGRVTEVLYNLHHPRGYRGLEVYILSTALLRDLVDECFAKAQYSWRRDVLRAKKDVLNLRCYIWKGFAAQIRSIQEYYDRSMQLLDPAIRAELFTPERPIRAKGADKTSTYVGSEGRCINSLEAEGCRIEGIVENYILFPGVVVEPGAVIRNCVLFKETVIHSNAHLAYIIADKDVEVLEGRTLMGHATYPIVLAKGSKV